MKTILFLLSFLFLPFSIFASTAINNYPDKDQIIDNVLWVGDGWKDAGWGSCTQPDVSLDSLGNYHLMYNRGTGAPYDNCYFDQNILRQTSQTCPTGYVIYGGTCVPSCPEGTFTSKFNICKTCPSGTIYDYNSDTCIDPNTCVSPFVLVNGICQDLRSFDNNPYECIRHGGLPDFSFVPRGGNFSSGGYVDPGISIHCNTKTGAFAKAALAVVLAKSLTDPLGYGPVGDSLLGRALTKMKSLWDNAFSTNSIPKDLTISLPRYDPITNITDVEIVSHDIPTGPDNITPSRQPNFNIDAYNEFLNDTYFPRNNIDPNSDSVSNLAEINRWNTDNAIFSDNATDPKTYTFTPNTDNIFKSTIGSSDTVIPKDSPQMVQDVQPSGFYTLGNTVDAPIFRVAPADSTFYPPVPVDLPPVNNVPSTSFFIDSVSGNSIRQWTNSVSFPDGSTSLEVTQIDEQLKRGSHTTTVVDPLGHSSTVSQTFDVPNYLPGSTDPQTMDIVKTSPSFSTPLPINRTVPGTSPLNPINPLTGYPQATDPSLPSSPLPAPDPASQDIINAPMPSYSFPAFGDFVPFV